MITRLTWYSGVVFLTSAIVMVLELCAARLLAPYLGVSLYTWTSIIGVVLGGLSLGSYLGGLWADSGATEKSAGIVMGFAGLFSLSILWLLSLIAPPMQNSELSLLSVTFVYMFVLFFVPATLLGIVMPLLTTLGLSLDTRTGHIVGRMHALGALGGIFGTFITGFWLIQAFGTRITIISCAILLLVLASTFLFGRNVSLLASIVSAVGVFFIQDKIPNPCDVESSYFCLRVVDVSPEAPFGRATGLVIDHLLHGVNHETEAGMLISPYVHLMDELPRNYFHSSQLDSLNYFFAGGGAYTLPRAIISNSPLAKIVVAEIDPAVTQMAKEKLYVNTEGMNIVHEDARLVLRSFENNSFDVLVVDVFHDISVPYHLLTEEFIQSIQVKLKPDGLLMANLVDIFPNPRLVKAYIKTLQTTFTYVDVWLDKLPEEVIRMTYVISANNVKPMPDVVIAQQGIDGQWINVSEPMKLIGDKLSALPVLTDDYVPIEKLISGLLLSPLGN